MYTTIEVHLEGAVELEEDVHPTEAGDRITYLIHHYSMYPGQIAIYSMAHDHPEDVDECSCVQYLTDHSPIFKREGTHAWRQAHTRLGNLYRNLMLTIDAGVDNGAFTPSTDNPDAIDHGARNLRRLYWDMVVGNRALIESTRQLIRDMEDHPSRRVTAPLPYEVWSDNQDHISA